MLLYCDTSALAKLVVAEPETDALLAELRDADLVTSALARTELRRAVRRLDDPEMDGRAVVVLAGVAQIVVDDDVLDRAATLGPPSMRSLDAVHLACALGLGDRLAGLVTYDKRMATAARAHGARVLSPGW